MTTLKNIIDDLAMGVLANTVMADQVTNTIHEKDYPKLISFINLGLTALHRRFLLRVGEVVIQQHPDIIRYALRSAYAASNVDSTQPIKYIVDTAENPFTDNVLKIEQVFSETGEEYLINDTTQAYPIYTPEFDVISMVPTEVDPQAVFVMYRANYPKITLSATFNPASLAVNIPDFILEALYLKIATYAYKGITSEDTESNPGRSYMYQYELECKRLEEENLIMNDNNPHNVFEVNGWV